VKDPVIEERASGLEYTVNVLIGRGGRVLSAVPHRRLEVRAGEVSKGVTTKDQRLLDLALRLGGALPEAFGALNFQCFLGDDGLFRVIEINPRFGGGYPLAHRAGVNFPKWLIEETLDLPSTSRFDEWEDGLAMLRYDEAVFIRREAIE
jgi:carbamoyl-phosphate synthase large subunit